MDILRKFIGKRSQTKTAPQVLREPAQSNYIWTRHNILYAEICKQHTAPETGAAHFVRACAIVWSHRVNFVLLLPPHIDSIRRLAAILLYMKWSIYFYMILISIFFFESHEDDGCNAICCKIKRTLVKICYVFLIYSRYLGMIHWLVVSTPLKNISQLGLFFQIHGKIENVPNHQPVHFHVDEM